MTNFSTILTKKKILESQKKDQSSFYEKNPTPDLNIIQNIFSLELVLPTLLLENEKVGSPVQASPSPIDSSNFTVEGDILSDNKVEPNILAASEEIWHKVY